MTYDSAIRPRLRAWTAALLTALLVAGGLSFSATAAQAATGDVAGATLDWGVKASFRSYITGPIAAGNWTVEGVTDATPFGWSGGSGSADVPTATGSVSYPGSVHFVGHGGVLDILFANPAIVQSSASSATLYVDTATATGVPLATLDLASGTNGSGAGTVAFSGVPAVLTADGAAAFGGFYTAGTALDPVSFSWPVEQAPAATATTTVLAVSPVTTSLAGASVTLTATVSPAADGTVQFLDGTTPVGTPVAVTAGQASYSSAAFALGAHSFSASFTPTDASAYAPSSATAVAHTVAPQSGVPTAYDEGSAAWGLSTYLNSANPGRPNPLPSAYVAPASFDATSRLTTWGGGSGTVNADGSATLAFRGASVNFAPTGGGWLRLADVQATLDAAGNGSVTALVSYGTAVGTNPITFDPAQAPDRGPQRVTIVNLAGNSVPVVQGADTATWANLGGTWSSEFTSFLAGSAPGIPGWPYASTVSSATGRTPLAFTFDLGIAPPPPAVTTALALAAAPTTAVVQGTTVTLKATVTPAAAGSVQFRNGSTVLGSAPVAGGVATLALPGLAVGGYSVTAYFTPADAAAFTASQSAALPLTVTAPVVAQAGSLIWGVKASLQSYVLGGGSIATSAGAGSSGSAFLFPQQSSAAFNQSTGTGTSAYRGAVTFSYPAHGFSIALSNPRVQVDSSTVGSLIVDVTFNGTTTSGVNFATLFLGAASKSSGAGSTTFAGAPAALTSAGAATFQGFYSTGEVLDPVTFVVGSPAASFTPTTASAPEPRTAAAAPPSTTGITLASGAKPVAGDEITITAEGFEPNEEGILVVVYSEPTVLDKNATADADGTLTWTGRLPAGLTGKHTLTFQGSVNRGVEVEIAARVTTAAEGCPVDAGTLTWGFKESFRSYISGSIANGEWIVSDGATYTTPEFGWSGGKGAYDAEGGLVAFTGAVEFTGHGGILDTTVANPQLRFIDADTAVLVLDVSGTTQDGATVDQQGVEFVDIDLSGAMENKDGTLTVTSAPTVLTPAGAAAFGTYEAGEPFDPVSFTLPLDAACAAPVVEPSETATVTAEPVASGSDLTWLWILIVAVLLLVIAAAVIIVTRRRRRAA